MDLKLELNSIKDRYCKTIKTHSEHMFSMYFSTPCIYFLINKSELVYIGETTSLMKRLSQHYDGSKIFTSFNYIEYTGSDKQRKDFEESLIKKFKPTYNIIHNDLSGISSDEIYTNIFINSFYNIDNSITYRIERCGKIIHSICIPSNSNNKDLVSSLMALKELQYFKNVRVISNSENFIKTVNKALPIWRKKDFKFKSGEAVHSRKEWEEILQFQYNGVTFHYKS